MYVDDFSRPDLCGTALVPVIVLLYQTHFPNTSPAPILCDVGALVPVNVPLYRTHFSKARFRGDFSTVSPLQFRLGEKEIMRLFSISVYTVLCCTCYFKFRQF